MFDLIPFATWFRCTIFSPSGATTGFIRVLFVFSCNVGDVFWIVVNFGGLVLFGFTMFDRRVAP